MARLDGAGLWPINVSAALGKWQHVALAFNGSTAHFFLNGVRVATRSYTGPVNDSAAQGKCFRVGYSQHTGDTASREFFDGLILNARVHESFLDASQLVLDSDGDGFNDSVEADFASSPLDPVSTPPSSEVTGSVRNSTGEAVAGATIDFEHLKQECEREYGALDVALLLQCGALELPRSPYVMRDQRVKAAFAANPVNRAIFGPKGLGKIAIPVAIASGSYDPAAPAAMEQAASFTWLTTPTKYWLMVEGQAHVNFTKIDPGIESAIESATNLTLPSQGLISSYINAITVPFFTSYIQNRDAFRLFLRSSFAEDLSKGETFKLDFISGASSADVKAGIEAFQKTHR
jgi:hypothetical protein